MTPESVETALLVSVLPPESKLNKPMSSTIVKPAAASWTILPSKMRFFEPRHVDERVGGLLAPLKYSGERGESPPPRWKGYEAIVAVLKVG